MAKNLSRSIRRHHRARLIKKYMNYEMLRWSAYQEDTEEERRRRATQVVNNISCCSCWMCGNPRTDSWASGKERLTMQERKENERFACDLLEVLDINTDYGKEHGTDC